MDTISKVTTGTPTDTAPASKPATPAAAPTPETAPAVPAASPTVQAAPVTQPTAAASKDEDSYDKMFPEPTVAIEGPPQWVWWFLLVIGSVVLGLVGFRLVNGSYGTGVVATSATATPTITPIVTASPSPEVTASPTPEVTATPVPSASASAITMRVLNGTKITGAAAAVRTTLQSAGFTVRTVGNAANQTYTGTVIYYKTGHLSDAESVQKALSGYKPTLEESTLASPDTILVVVGPHT